WRWPSGFVCPVCAGEHHSFVKTRALYQCTACRRQTSVIAGTIFAATKVPLCTWFRAMYHLIKEMAGYRIPPAVIARVHGISERTLERHCAEELATGKTDANVNVAGFLYGAIMGSAVKSDHARITAAIFWAKTRMGWKETQVLEHKDGDAEEQSLRDSIDSKFDRVAVTGTANGFFAEPE